MASHSHCHHLSCFPRLGKVGWNTTWCKCANHATTLWLRLENLSNCIPCPWCTYMRVLNWGEVILVAWLFCLPKLHLLILSRCKFGGIIILSAKITCTCFPSKASRSYFSGKRYCECFLTFTLIYVQYEMYFVPTWKNNRIPNFANQNSNMMSFQHWNSQKKIIPEYPESETESKFCSWWGSQKSELKIGISNLVPWLAVALLLVALPLDVPP